ncbi:MAG TPA: ATP-binding cassette domain-containing protein [Clostridia bacterium]|nr:ATP-binding cassette domain-containing protein [Clostridia bacterium]
MIEAREIRLQYPDGTVALENLSLSVGAGELVFILGPSGSGKTSLLKLLMGLEFPTQGRLRVMDYMPAPSQTRAVREMRRKIGPVSQDFSLINGRSALENVMLGLRILGMPPKQMEAEAKEALAKVGLAHKYGTLVENLSWGERQRVAIARAVARHPRLILADEPTGNLDQGNAVQVLELLASFVSDATTVIITTHATHLIPAGRELRCIELRQGQIIRDEKGCRYLENAVL